MELDAKGLEAAAAAYKEEWASWHVNNKDIFIACLSAAIRAYLAATGEAVARDDVLDRDELLGLTEFLMEQADIDAEDADHDCDDLCGNRVCDQVGCVVSKYRRVRALKVIPATPEAK